MLDSEIVKCKSSLKVADYIIEDAKDNLQKALSKKNIDQRLGLALKERKFENDLDILEKNKKMQE